MKIAVIGFSGGGKSTLARRLGDLYGVEVLHLDTVHHLSGWRSRPREESRAMVEAFLNTHDASGWVIDGNYGKLAYDRRMEEADRIEAEETQSQVLDDQDLFKAADGRGEVGR